MSDSSAPIRVVIVDDSPICRELMRDIVEADGDMEVVALAADGRLGLEAIGAAKPDLVLLDLRMPGMDGLSLVEHVMVETPTPILVITADAAGVRREGVFEAVRRGALDVAAKPHAEDAEAASALRRRARELARIPVVRHMTRRAPSSAPPPASADGGTGGRISAIGIAASAGGPAAVLATLERLPAGFATPIALVQHLPLGFVSSFASFIEARTALRVRIVDRPTRATPGEVLLADGDAHLVLGADGRFDALEGPPVDGHRPSATVLFRSLAERLGPRAIGVILSGMGRDGVDGLAALRARGALTLAQSRESAAVWGMPRAATQEGAARLQLSPAAIGRALVEATRQSQGEEKRA